MAKVKLGRPKGKALLLKEDILKSALMLLDKSGPKGLSMRNLAQHLKVTPMALYHHVADRSSLIRDLSDLVYAEVSEKFQKSTGTVRERLELLLTSYHQTIIEHPNLSISIFETPDAFSTEARRITGFLLDLLKETELTDSKRKIWLSILVDFTHGSAIAMAMNKTLQSSQFRKELRELLDCIFNK